MSTTTPWGGSAASTTIFATTSIPAYSLGTNGILRIRLLSTLFGGATDPAWITATLGGTTILSASADMTAAYNNNDITITIINTGYNSQEVVTTGLFGDSRATAINTAVANNLVINGRTTSGNFSVWGAYIEAINYTK